MADKTPGSIIYADDFFIKQAGIKASEVLTKGDLCSTVVNQLAKITTDEYVAVAGFAQVTETKTGNGTNGGEQVDVICRGGKIIMKCINGLESGQDVALDVTSGVQKAIPCDATMFAAGKRIGHFVHYVNLELTEDGSDGDYGVIQT